MTRIDDRLRDYYAARASAVGPETIRDSIRLPAARPRSRLTAFAPLAAAAAVMAIVITAIAIGSVLHTGRSSGVTTGMTPSPGQRSVAELVAAGVIPPRFVTITATGDPDVSPSYATVRSTATGSVLATIRPSLPHGTIVAVTGAADDRTFVLAEQKLPVAPRASLSIEHGALFLLRLRSDGTVRTLARLPVTADDAVNGLALSADGTRLAMSARPLARPGVSEIQVYTLATGARRTWSQNEGDGVLADGTQDADAAAISWAADGRHLLFNWAGSNMDVRLLDTSAAGSSLIAASRLVVRIPTPAGRALPCQGDLVITPDGSAVICPGVTEHGESDSIFFREYSTATGKVVRQLGNWTYHTGRFVLNALWTNLSGSVIIGVIPKPGAIPDGPSIGVIIGNTFTPLHAPGVTSGVW